MDNTKKIKTFTPVLPVGKGGTGTKLEDALYDILFNLNEENCLTNPFSDNKIISLAECLADITGMRDWIDGEYTLFDEYKLIIETMPVSQFEELPEFNGY